MAEEEVADNPESPKKHTASRGRKPKTSATVGPADPEVDEPPHSEEVNLVAHIFKLFF